MATQIPPLKNTIYYFEIGLVSRANPDIFQITPTLAAGDVRVFQDGAAPANIAALPVEIAASGVLTVTLTAAEMNADRIAVLFADQAGAEWQDRLVCIHTASIQLDSLVAAIWSFARRTLTWALCSFRRIPCSDICIDAADFLDLDITGLGDITGRTKLWFTAKESKEDLDTAAWIQIEETAGLVYINGAAATVPANGAITVNNAARGDITITLDGVETLKLTDAEGKGYFDIKWINAAGRQLTLHRGKCTIIADVTRAVT